MTRYAFVFHFFDEGCQKYANYLGHLKSYHTMIIFLQLRAHQLDTKNTSLKNTRGNIMHKPGGAKYQDL